MEYKKIGETYYVRMDRGDEIISNILEICRKESILSDIFSGIGGCSSAELQVFIPETGSFETEQLEGMLELVSLNGNVVSDDDGQLYHHTHALFSFKKDGQHGMAGGHPERRSSGSQFYIVWGQIYNEGQLRQFSKQLRMQKVQAAFNDLAANHRDEIMQMRRERNRAGLQELQDKLAAEAESKVGKSGLTDDQLKIYSTYRNADFSY